MSIEITSINGMGAVTETSPGVFTTTGMKDDDHMHVVNDFLTGAGVVNPITDYLVTQKGAGANMSVDVSVGTAYVLNSSWSANTNLYTRYWRAVNDATVNVAIGANASGNPRIDIVCLKVDTAVTPDGTASNVATIVVVAGTPAGSPSVPATPANHLLLAQVAVANGAASIVNANITDRKIVATVSDNSGDWKYSNEVWTYASASTFTITGDKTGKYQKGMPIRWKQGGAWKYGNIYSAVYSSPNTTITIIVNTDYTVANSAITDGYYSYSASPFGFPASFNFTPTWTALAVNNGTINISAYSIVHNIVNLNIYVTLGSTSAISGNVLYTLPVQASSIEPISQNAGIGMTRYENSGVANYQGITILGSVTVGRLLQIVVNGSSLALGSLSSSSPFTWGDTDIISVKATYII